MRTNVEYRIQALPTGAQPIKKPMCVYPQTAITPWYEKLTAYFSLPSTSLAHSSANNTSQKMYNWNTMNQKVFKRLGFSVAKLDLEAVSNCQVGLASASRGMEFCSLRVRRLQCASCAKQMHVSNAFVVGT